jgi:PAT family beta-lactamase induction signal transducer AmpG
MLRAVYQAVRYRECVLLLLAAITAGIGWGLGLGLMPLLAVKEAGMPQAAYGALSGSANLVAGMLGLLLFGVIADLIGPLRLFRTAFGLIALAIGIMLMAQPLWASPWPITLFVFAMLGLRVMQQVCFGALAMGLCNPAVGATHMTILMTSSNLGATIGSLLIGTVAGLGGHPAMLGGMFVFYLLALGFAFAKRVDARPGAVDEAAALATAGSS